MSSTGSDGAIHVFALTLYTEACTPSAFISEKSLKCSPPALISAHTPSSNIRPPINQTSILAHAFDADIAFESGSCDAEGFTRRRALAKSDKYFINIRLCTRIRKSMQLAWVSESRGLRGLGDKFVTMGCWYGDLI